VGTLLIDTTVITPPDIVGVTYGPSGSDPAWTIRTSLVDNQARTILLGFISFGVFPPHPTDTLCYLHFDLDATDQFFVWLDTAAIGANHLTVTDTTATEQIPVWSGGSIWSLYDGRAEPSPSQVDFALQAAPNPFNSATRINSRYRGSDHVTLTIADVLGREVDRLGTEIFRPACQGGLGRTLFRRPSCRLEDLLCTPADRQGKEVTRALTLLR
jgi:hypothetical protein